MKRACIVIPIYKQLLSAAELISLQQCLKILNNYDIFLIIPKRLEYALPSTKFMKFKELRYKVFKDHFFANTIGYNQLMKYPGFYKAFLDYEFMLIYQLDAFVFKDELSHWCNLGFDYIGAPFVNPSEEGTNAIIGQGNGGFSLRKVASFYRILQQFKKLNFKHPFYDPNRPFYINLWRDIKYKLIYNFSIYPFQPVVNEDIFWAELIPKAFKEFKVPAPIESVPFSFEVCPGKLYSLNNHNLPFGCHGWYTYEPHFWQTHIREAGYEI